MKELYNMIFKRKSFRRFNNTLNLSDKELEDIKNKIDSLIPLVEDINIAYKIVPKEETTCKRGEYCLLIYSEEKDNYLLNIGYMFEQLDLYLASKDIGVCWYGMGKTNQPSFKNLKFVIMLALGKASKDEFRKDYKKAKRKETKDIWKGDLSVEVGEVVKYAPSACNTQPWRVIAEDNILKIYRETKIKSIMPKAKIPFYNSIDMGIFLCFLEIVLLHNNIYFNRSIINKKDISKLIPIGRYVLNKL